MRKTFFSLLTIGAMVAGFIACKEEVQYDIEIDNPKTTLTVGEKIEIKITSTPEGLDLSAVEYEFSPEGIIDASRIDNGFLLVAKKNGKTRLKISCGKFEKEIPFTVNAKKTETNSDSGNSDSGSEKEDEGETPKPETPEEPSDSTKTEPTPVEPSDSIKPEPTPVEPADTTKTEPQTPQKVSVIFNTGEGGYYLNSNNSITRATIRIGTPGANLPAPPEITFNPKYEFIGWKPELPKVYPDTATTYTAQYKPKPKSKIIFQIQNSAEGSFGADVQTEFEGVVGTSFEASKAPTPTPASADYRFKNWNTAIPATFTESTQYVTAVFENKVTVTLSAGAKGLYKTGTGRNTISRASLTKKGFPGDELTDEPSGTTRLVANDGWEFSHWSPSVPSVYPTSDETYTAQYKECTTGTDNGHDWVDLGLPSGTRWATINVGASSSTQLGEEYSFAAIKPYNNDVMYRNSDFNYTKYTLTGYKGVGGTTPPPPDNKKFGSRLEYRFISKNFKQS